MNSYPLSFPLQHPAALLQDPAFEEKIGKIILLPLRLRISITVSKFIRKILRIPSGKSTKQFIKESFK